MKILCPSSFWNNGRSPILPIQVHFFMSGIEEEMPESPGINDVDGGNSPGARGGMVDELGNWNNFWGNSSGPDDYSDPDFGGGGRGNSTLLDAVQ